MHRRLFALLIALGLLCGACAARAAASPSAAFGVTIRVEGEGWGSAERDEIETLLYAVADELVTRPARNFDRPIVVTFAPGSPVTLYERGPAGEYQVQLSATGRRWAQYVYQFGHELCHVMSNFDVLASAPNRRRNQWFEEALCETAGLFALRSLAARWQSAAPYPAWQDYAPTLRAYADRLTAEPHRQLPNGASVGAWLHASLERLESDPYARHDNEVVANLLLPLFEREPDQWAALHSLNLHPADGVAELPRLLRNWRSNAPREHGAFIDALAGELGLGPAMTTADTSTPATPTTRPVTASGLRDAQAGSAGPLSD